MVLGLSQVPRDQVEAATRSRRLAAGRSLRNVEMPIALPGILIGALLVFVLALGATAESAMLGGQSVTVIGQVDRAALQLCAGLAVGLGAGHGLVRESRRLVVFPLMRRLDIDRLFRR